MGVPARGIPRGIVLIGFVLAGHAQNDWLENINTEWDGSKLGPWERIFRRSTHLLSFLSEDAWLHGTPCGIDTEPYGVPVC